MGSGQISKHATQLELAPRRAADFEPLIDLWVASWRAAMPHIDFEARRQWFGAHLLATEAEGGQTICAFAQKNLANENLANENRLAGFVLIVAPRAYLEQIAVLPRYFGCGVARRLLDAAKSSCPQGLDLDVNADNPRALRFYQREGFRRGAAGRNPRSGLATFTMRWP